MSDTFFLDCPYCGKVTRMPDPKAVDYAIEFTMCDHCGKMCRFAGGELQDWEGQIHFGYPPDGRRYSYPMEPGPQPIQAPQVEILTEYKYVAPPPDKKVAYKDISA